MTNYAEIIRQMVVERKRMTTARTEADELYAKYELVSSELINATKELKLLEDKLKGAIDAECALEVPSETAC